MDVSAIWQPFLTEQDREHLAMWGKREPASFGDHPALLIIDDYYGALGDKREPILESIKTWPSSCGLEGWEAIDRTVELLAAARAYGIPVMYTRGLPGFNSESPWGRRSGSKPRRGRSPMPADRLALSNEIIAELAPLPGELVIEKGAASGFNGTALTFRLNYLGIDTVIACGETTSGCVRASVVDGAMLRYRMGVVAECCFDRTQSSHAMNLFDLHQKYADVVDLPTAIAYFASVGKPEAALVPAG